MQNITHPNPRTTKYREIIEPVFGLDTQEKPLKKLLVVSPKALHADEIIPGTDKRKNYKTLYIP